MSAASTCKRIRIRVRGIVQGVGFRPFVYQLALRYELGGYVHNDGQGVLVEFEGESTGVEAALLALKEAPPPLARIDEVVFEPIALQHEKAFVIRQSETGTVSAMVSPDIALCDTCKAEMRDPVNRRHGYALINCTDCGPRYSIIESLPYDRPNTSMKAFSMCPACEAEYNDPANRRYHAQPISCFDCGPRLRLWRSAKGWTTDEGICVETVADLILDGRIVAIKGMGGFHLVCDATNETAVQTLRERKHRPSKPLAAMFPTLEAIEAVADLGETERKLILSKERPIVVVRKNRRGHLASAVAPGIDRIGVFLPYTPLHLLLMEKLQRPIVATSANRSEEPIIIDAPTLLSRLGHVIDAVLDHERPIVNACDDSVVMVAQGQALMLRLARGYAPRSLPLPFETPKKILALGANQKNSIALAFGKHAILSPHIGDLGTLEANEYFERTVKIFGHFYGFVPDVIVCDLHPGYETTKWANQLKMKNEKIKIVQVQHHYAHALSCMAEAGLNEEVLAFSFDGTGYGEDGTLWGGEVLLADLWTYRRALSLRPFRLLGGEKAIREPRRVALALLFECYSLDEVLVMENPTVKSFNVSEIETLHAMWQRGLNAPLCSSVGRLFDAVASLTGTAQTLGYEGESGLLLEAAAAKVQPRQGFAFDIGESVFDWEPLLRRILATSDKEACALGLHAALADAIAHIASRYPDRQAVFSGGVFQNRTLVSLAIERLEAAGIRWHIPQTVPVNDGGIALGQLYHVLYKERE